MRIGHLATLLLVFLTPAFADDPGEATPDAPADLLDPGAAGSFQTGTAGDLGGADAKGVDVNRFGTVDLTVRGEDLSEVLRMLGDGAGKNIVFGSEVAGTVTTSLRDVTLEEALSAILKVNGYGHVEEGNFIYVYPLEAIAEMAAAAKLTVEKILPLYYLQGAEAARLAEPLLSTVGQVISLGDVEEGYDPDTQSGGVDSYAFAAKLIIYDYPERIERIEALIAELDIPPKQVLVEGTILAAAVGEDNAFGVDMSFVVNPIDAINFVNPIHLVDEVLNPGAFTPNTSHTTVGQSTVGQVSEAAGSKSALFKTTSISLCVRSMR